MALKSLAEILASKDGEQAYLYILQDPEDEGGVRRSSEDVDQLHELCVEWAKEFVGEDYSAGLMSKLSSDDGRRVLLEYLTQSGDYEELIGTFVDDRAAAHRPLMLDFFIENCDDPGYFDEILTGCADKLSDADKLRLLEKKFGLA